MASDPDRPLLRLIPQAERDRPVGRQRAIPRPEAFPTDRQTATFTPKFNRLAEVLNRDPTGLELRADPTALAPERLLVFEVRSSIASFAGAIQRVPGLELVDEEELVADEDKAPVAYLMVPDIQALKNIESLWRRWLRGQLAQGETPWRDVFSLLRDLRPWGPTDRVLATDLDILSEEIDGRNDDDLVRLEVELVFRPNDHVAHDREEEARTAVVGRTGRIVSRCRIPEIAYHALLVELPVRFIREIIERSTAGIAGLETVMHIRPQSLATSIELAEPTEREGSAEAGQLGAPILALFDGVPVAAHVLLSDHVVVDDQFGLEPQAPVADRVHGTAMASLIIHGDRNRDEAPLSRRIHVVPVLGAADAFPDDRLVVDLIYNAVFAMRGGTEPSAPDVLIVNVSLGNRRRPFHGSLSAWARLLDRLSYQLGILFVVSAGNNIEPFGVPAYATRTAFEDSPANDKSIAVLRALGNIVADRRVLSPAETVNGITVGACNDDAVSDDQRLTARVNVNPYPALKMANPSSSLGPGFALSVKPDVLLPGAREHLRVVRNHTYIDVQPAGPSRAAGLRVAAPPRDGLENVGGFTNGTSAAAALASRTCHLIHDALEAAYGDDFIKLPHRQRAVLLKALLAHPARWPDDAATLIRSVIGPPDGRLHVRQKDNIRRFLGYGVVDSGDAVACAADRATFWATGLLERDKIVTVSLPVPVVMGGQARPHSLFATVAWFTPVTPGRRTYRSVRLRLLEPRELDALAVRAHANQPDTNQANRGTLFMRCWAGAKAPVVGPNMTIDLTVQRDPDQGLPIDEPIPFGLATTLSMPGVLQVYDQVRQRLTITPRASA
jgi:Subtilase family